MRIIPVQNWSAIFFDTLQVGIIIALKARYKFSPHLDATGPFLFFSKKIGILYKSVAIPCWKMKQLIFKKWSCDGTTENAGNVPITFSKGAGMSCLL